MDIAFTAYYKVKRPGKRRPEFRWHSQYCSTWLEAAEIAVNRHEARVTSPYVIQHVDGTPILRMTSKIMDFWEITTETGIN